jgi:glycolate oxidase FAD binding subunit
VPSPATAQEAAALMHDAAREGAAVRVRGGGTKLGWGRPVSDGALELSTARLDALVAHNPGDFTAILGAGLPLRRAQETFAAAGQQLALDPPLGRGDGATIGGVIATADSGPLRHRHGAPRDLVLGVQLALPDGTVARAGGQVIKNVAGYDLAKLAAGSFGTLGVICEVAVRLHPLPIETASAHLRSSDPAELAAAAAALAHGPFEHVALDVAWEGTEGTLLARFTGAVAHEQAAAAAAASGGEVLEDDRAAWDAQRAAQRAPDRIVVRVSATQRNLPTLLATARAVGARAVARAALVVAYLALPADAGAEAIGELRARLPGLACVVTDAPAAVRAAVDPWGEVASAPLELLRRVKERFDPLRTCNPGIFVGGL